MDLPVFQGEHKESLYWETYRPHVYFGVRARNMVENFYQTGYLWEQYDQKKGKGKGTPMFTGWTSLVLLIMAVDYSTC